MPFGSCVCICNTAIVFIPSAYFIQFKYGVKLFSKNLSNPFVKLSLWRMENKSIAIVLHNIPGKQTFTDVCECRCYALCCFFKYWMNFIFKERGFDYMPQQLLFLIMYPIDLK